MTQPQAYNRETDFTERDGDDTNHAGINTELDAAALSINQLRDNLALIQADDGGLKAGIVTAESLDDSAFDAILVNVNLGVSDAQTAAESANIAALSANAARDQAVTAKENAETANNAAALNAATAALKAAETASAVAQAVDGEKDLFTAGVEYTKGTTTQLTLAYAPAKSGTVKVFFDGVFQHLTEWSLAGNVITFTAAITADKVEVHYVIPSQFVGLSNADLLVLGEAEAAAQAGAASAQADAATATAAKTAAELARDVALIQAGVYTTEAAGRAAVADGVAFKVQGSGDVAAYEYRRTNSTTSVLIATYPSLAAVDEVRSYLVEPVMPIANRVAFAFTDDDGFGAVRISVDGNLIGPVGIENNAGIVTTKIYANGDCETLATYEQVLNSPAGFVAWTDEDGNASKIINPNGSITSPPELSAPALTLDGQLQHVVSYGQSLSLGWASPPVTTTVQRHSALKFSGGVRPFDSGVNPAVIYASLQPLTETYDGASSYETPLAGMFEILYDSMELENDISYTDIDFRFLGSCAGKDGLPISSFTSGTYYNRFVEQIQYGKTRANALGLSYRVKAFCWTQGESDSATPQATYLAALKSLRANLQTSVQTITGVADQLLCIHYQTYSNESATAASPASLAQLQAHEEEPTKFALACPIYFMNNDGAHLPALHSALLGAYYGIVYKRMVLEGGTWTATRPTRVYSPAANTIDVVFTCEGNKLEWDFDGVAVQPGNGFSVVDGSGVLQTISTVQIIGRKTVRITLAGAVPSGAKVRYGVRARTSGIADSAGYPARRLAGSACGNLRDNYGTKIKFKKLGSIYPLHNWCVIFEKGVI